MANVVLGVEVCTGGCGASCGGDEWEDYERGMSLALFILCLKTKEENLHT